MKTLRQWAKYIIPFLFAVLIFSFVTQHDQTLAMMKTVLDGLGFLLGRFAVGFGLAYFLNFLLRFFERRFKLRRGLSLLATYVIFLGFLGILAGIVIPSMADSAKSISLSFSLYYQQVMELLDGVIVNLPTETAVVVNDTIMSITEAVVGGLKQLLSWDFVGTAFSGMSRSLANLLFGTLISVYALWDKEALKSGATRVLYAFFPKRISDFTLHLAHDTDAIFSHYLIGKVLDSTIMGILSLIFFLIFKLPVAPFLAMVVMITNMIPYFGPVIGGVICGVILLGFSPMYCLIGIIIIVILQCLDGTVIGPKILGDAVGISPLLTVISITLGGDLFGVAGIFFAVPVVGTLKTVVVDKVLNARLKKQGLDTEHPECSDSASPLEGQLGIEDTEDSTLS